MTRWRQESGGRDDRVSCRCRLVGIANTFFFFTHGISKSADKSPQHGTRRQQHTWEKYKANWQLKRTVAAEDFDFVQ